MPQHRRLIPPTLLHAQLGENEVGLDTMRLDDFPRFRAEHTVVHGKQLSVYGRFDHLTNVRECRSWLLQGTTAVYGDLEELDPASRTAVFQCWEEEFGEELFYRGLIWAGGAYDASDLFQVLDEDHEWVRTEFQVADAISTPVEDGWRSLRKASEGDEQELGPYDTVIEGGWNHEHCFICHETIWVEKPACYVSVNDEGQTWWACADCYKKWVQPRDVGFIGGKVMPFHGR